MKNLTLNVRPMKSMTTTARLACAGLAAAITLTLFSSVISISEPQRSELMAQIRHADVVAAAQTMIQVATGPTSGTQSAK
jgi:hypothetical protein